MKNDNVEVVEINWDEMRVEYVTSPAYPDFSTLSKKYGVAIRLIVSKANNREEPMNRGKTWSEQRDEHIDKKRSVEENITDVEMKKKINTFIKALSNLSLKSYKIMEAFLDDIEKAQKLARENGDFFNVSKYVKISELTSMIALMKNLGEEKGNKLVIELKGLVDKGEVKSIEDLSDEKLRELTFAFDGEDK